MKEILFGIDNFPCSDAYKRLKGARVGLLTHLPAVDRDFITTVDRIASLPDLTLRALFTPEHGLYGVAQAGDGITDERHPRCGIPVYSLYGTRKQPTPEMLADLDALLVDFQDVGVRFYTYLTALGYLLAAAAEHKLPVIVLDRPNPIGGEVAEGPLTRPDCLSYVGRWPLPLRTGLTIGETALWIAEHEQLPVDLDVVPLSGWSRGLYFDETDRHWIPPSPNMPTVDTAVVYPGLALLEGTSVSEGRGTTRPFETFGAPWIDAPALIDRFHSLQLAGVKLRETHFVPTFSKHAGQRCRGAQVHVTDRAAFRPLEAGLHLVQLLHDLHPEDFRWTEPVNGRHFLDLLVGTSELREAVEGGSDLTTVYKRWQREAQAFHAARRANFLYS